MRTLILILGIFIGFTGFSQNEELFDKANSAYQGGDYENAIRGYEEILKNGESSAELYYNLGNAHYKLNHVAPSIYFYEKALQLDPTDADIKNNIEFARNMAIDDIEVVEQTGIDQWINGIISTFNYSTWSVLAIICSVIFVALFLLYYFSYRSVYKRVFFGTSVLFVLICIFCVVFAFQQRSYVQDNQFAIIFGEEVEVRDEPNLRGDASFELHEGTKAKVLEEYQDWSKIELANGAQGWIKKSEIKKL